MNEPDSLPQEFNQVREDLLFTSYCSGRSQAVGNGFIVILWVDFFVLFRQPIHEPKRLGSLRLLGYSWRFQKKVRCSTSNYISIIADTRAFR